MKMIKIGLAAFATLAFAAFAIAQNTPTPSGLFANFPIVGGASYCSSYVNNSCVNTVAAGPSGVTGNETYLAGTGNTANGPYNVLVPGAALGALPITVSASNVGVYNYISASALSGGYIFTGSTTITGVNVTLPPNAVQGQTFVINANRTITNLGVSAASGDSIAANSAPTALTASTTAVQGYKFWYNRTSTTAGTWYRLQ